MQRIFAPLLFRDRLRWITPLLWIAYIFSSMTVFFLATWTPLVFEALNYTRSQAALAGSLSACPLFDPSMGCSSSNMAMT